MSKQKNKTLSLEEMLELAKQISNWQFFQLEDWFGIPIDEGYIGTINEINIKIGKQVIWPFPGRLPYIKASYRNIVLGEFPCKLEQDKRLNDFLYNLPNNIIQQGLNIARKNK